MCVCTCVPRALSKTQLEACGFRFLQFSLLPRASWLPCPAQGTVLRGVSGAPLAQVQTEERVTTCGAENGFGPIYKAVSAPTEGEPYKVFPQSSQLSDRGTQESESRGLH